MLKRLLLGLLKVALLLSASTAIAQDDSETTRPSESTSKRFIFGMRYGTIRFTGNRAFKKYSHELLNKDNPTGLVAWPDFVFNFNQPGLLRPIFSLRVGLAYFYGEESRGYQNSKLKVTTEGSLLEHGFRLGFYPALSWLFLYQEIGVAHPLVETITFESPTGKKSFRDEQRWISVMSSFGARFELPKGFHIEGVGTFSLDDLSDEMLTLGVGYGF